MSTLTKGKHGWTLTDDRPASQTDWERQNRTQITMSEYLRRAGLTDADRDEAQTLGLIPPGLFLQRHRVTVLGARTEVVAREDRAMDHLQRWRALARRVHQSA